MFDWGKSSGVDAPRKKITFLAPTPFRGFLGVRGSAHYADSGRARFLEGQQ